MPAIWLHPTELDFPSPDSFDTPDVIAVGGDLSPDRLYVAYTMGIFPWYNEDEPILWWSPEPRMVLFPEDLIIAKSMRSYFNQKKFEVTYNTDFKGVMTACKNTNRDGQDGTWINDEMIEAYYALHQRGHAHSVEVWQNSDMVGGLYGIKIGKIFYGESMFATVSNASKFGFINLVLKLKDEGIVMIDCQQKTRHLSSLGAISISRAQFYTILKKQAR